MGIQDGQKVNQENSNAAWLPKGVEGGDALGVIGLKNTDPASGSNINNPQREFNALWSFLGGVVNQIKDILPSWTNNNGFTSTDNVKTRVDVIGGKFHQSTGHKHTGAAGDAPPIQSSEITGVALRGFQVRATDIASPSGSSINVTSLMAGKTVSTSQLVKGVVTNAPYNEIVLKRLTGSESDTHLEDTNGNVVFGRLTESAGVWTLSFFTDISGVETAYTMTGADTAAGLKWWFIELFNPMVDAPVYPESIFIPSDNYTQEILDASISQRGVVSTGAQSFEGEKTFEKPIVSKVQGSTPTSPPSTYYKLYPKADGFYYLDSSGAEKKVGSGGSGLRNFVLNGDGEDAQASIFTTYKDTAAARPVDGTGGTPTVATTSISTISPLDGFKSYLLTKSASNGQGEGWSIALQTIPAAFRSRVLEIEFDYLVNSGTFVAGSKTTDSDVIVYLYDITNGVLIEPSSFKLLSNSSSIVDRFSATFQTSATGSQYRLIFHIATTSVSAYELKVDNVSVSPSVYAFGTPVTEWTAASGSITAESGTNPTFSNQEFWTRRVGDSLEIRYRALVTAAGSSSVSLGFNIPNSLVADSTKVIIGGTGQQGQIGAGSQYDDSAVQKNISLTHVLNTSTRVLILRNDGDSSLFSDNVGNNDRLSGLVSIPISGWSSSVQMSEKSDQRIVAARLSGSPTGLGAGAILTGSVGYDTHGAFSSSRFTAPQAGFYKISGAVRQSSAINFTLYAYIDAVISDELVGVSSSNSLTNAYNTTVYLNAGQIIDVRTNAGTLNCSFFSFLVERVSGMQQIAATELVAAAVAITATQTIETGAGENIIYTTKDFDTHNAFDTTNGRFTAPIAGIYEISSMVTFTSHNPAAVSNQYEFYVAKNGANSKGLGVRNAMVTSAQYVSFTGSVLMRLNAGDYVNIFISQTTGSNQTLLGNASFNWATFKRIGL